MEITILHVFTWLSCLQLVLSITRPPGIFIQPAFNVYYKVGETVEITCVADGEPQPTYKWKRDGIDFTVAGNDDRMVQLAGVGTIVINRPEDKDEAIYQCFADNGYGISASININLREAKLDEFARGPTRKNKRKLGEPLTLNCILPDSVPSAEFYWAVKEPHAGYVAIRYNARVTVDHEARLRFTNVIKDDAQDGRPYACMAMNQNVRAVSQGVPNIIEYEGDTPVLLPVAYMWASPTDHYGLVGNEFRLKCIFSGNPTPDVHWAKTRGGNLPEHVKIKSFGQELFFTSLTFDDAGEYECWATNTQSQRRELRTFEIRVESKPYWIREPKDLELGLGGSARYYCVGGGIPEPTVRFFVNGVPISDVTDPRLTNGRFRTIGTTAIELINVTRDDAMVFQCNVTNKHGYLWGDFYLNVLSEAPTIINPPDDNKITAEGLSVNVSCGNTGKPDPIVTWFVEGQQITGGRYLTQLNGDLLINSVVLSDAGQYMCEVENRYGKVNATGRLIVRRKTLIEQEPLDLEVVAGTDAKFTCSGTTDPEEVHNLQILWEKDNKPITPNDQRMTTNIQDSSLTISGTITRDSGTYTCIATNGLDYSRKSAMLIVKDRPDAPTDVVVEKCDKNATITFTPGSYNNAPIQYFVVQYNTTFNPDQWVFGLKAQPSETRVGIPLSPYANFTYRVIAYNKIGESDPSFPSKTGCTTNNALPEQNPKNVRSIGYKKNYLYIEWTPMPPILHNGPDFAYVLQIKRKGDPDSTIEPKTISDWKVDHYEMSTGDIYKPYEITLKAKNADGDAGNVRTIIGYSGEDIPVVLPSNFQTVVVNDTSATLSWTFDMNTVGVEDTPIRGEFRGFKIQYWQRNNKEYTVRYWDVSAEEAISGATGNKITTVVRNLLPFTDIDARVSVMNNFYVSRPTDILSFRTLPGVPGPVGRFTAQSIGSNHFNLEWTEPLDKNGYIIGYDIGYQTVHGLDLGKMQDREPQIRDPNQNFAMLSGLLTETRYRVYIWARTEKGRGDSYFIELKTTLPGSPEAPKYTIESVGENYINVTWWLNNYVKSGTVIFVEYRKVDAPEWLKSTDEVINRWKNITDLESGTTYEIRVVATNGPIRSESSITKVTTVGIAMASALIANIGWFLGMLVAVVVIVAIGVLICWCVRAGKGFKRVEQDEPHDSHNARVVYADKERLPAKMGEPGGEVNNYYQERDSYYDDDRKSDRPPSYQDYDRYDRRDSYKDDYDDDDDDYYKRDSYNRDDDYYRRDSYEGKDRDSYHDDYRDEYRDDYRRDPYDYPRQTSASYEPDVDSREPNKFNKYGEPRQHDDVAQSDRSSHYSDRYEPMVVNRPGGGAQGGASSSFV